MTIHKDILALLVCVSLVGCADIGRSRNLADPAVSGVTLAQQVCSNCHGLGGLSTNPTFPNLAGQMPDYFTAQMLGFKSHGRQDPAGFEYMWGLSRSLTEAQVRELASYYAAKPSAAPQRSSDAASVARGQTLFEKGLAEKSVPACGACHGPQAQGMATFPRLAHQHADYLVKQLQGFQRTNDRPDGAIMKTIAHELTDANIHDVAAYLEQLAGP